MSKFLKVLAVLFVLFAVLLVVAHRLRGNLTIETNTEVTLTKCAEDWPYEFDCLEINGKNHCRGPADLEFDGFPNCTPEEVQTGTEFTDQEPGRIYVVESEESTVRFVGFKTPGKPRRFNVGKLRIKVITKR